MASNPLTFQYDVALSFAGENRALVEVLADDLVAQGVRVFYDAYEQADLWGKDLYQHLQSVYRDKARYCLVFVSRSYAEKVWTRHELHQAQARALEEHREYILPVRLDDTEIPGLNLTIGYIDLRRYSVSQLRDFVLRKLGHTVDDSAGSGVEWDGKYVEFRGQSVVSNWPEQIGRAQLKTTYSMEYPRVRWGEEDFFRGKTGPTEACGDCAAAPGEFHDPGCDIEQCPACRRQALGCNCELK